MKIAGKKICAPNIEYVIIPRPQNQFVFKCEAIKSWRPFDELCPVPMTATRIRKLPGGAIENLPPDPSGNAALATREQLRFDYMVIESLTEASFGDGFAPIEWEQVNHPLPETWSSWRSELLEAGLSVTEINLIGAGCLTANSLNDEKLETARAHFLATLQEASG